MLDWKLIIKEETERGGMTSFPTEDGKGIYHYVILPFDSRIKPSFLKAIIQGMTTMLKEEIKKASTIVLPEAKAFLLTPIAEATGLDLTLIRKRNYRTPNQIVIEQKKAYKDKEGQNYLYCVGLKKDDKVLIVDDFVSSGGTQISTIKSLKDNGFDIVGAATVYERGNGIEEVKRQTGHSIKGLVRLEVINKKLPSGKIVKRPFVSRIFDTKF